MINPTYNHIATIKLTLLAHKAVPSPLLGQALGQYGLNILNFCKLFNDKTKNIKEHIYLPTRVIIHGSRDQQQSFFKVIIKSPSTTFLLKHTLSLLKGNSSTSSKTYSSIWAVDLREIYHLSLLKSHESSVSPYLNFYSSSSSPKNLCKTFIGSAKSIGLHILSA